MSTTLVIRPVGGTGLSQLCRSFAVLLPALIIGYSALIDPLINFGLAKGVQFGGVELGAEGKSTFLTKIIMPMFLAFSALLTLFARPIVPQRLRAVVLPGALMLSLACVSALWARAPIVTLTFAAYMTILYGSLLFSVMVAGDPHRIVRCVLAVFALVVAANLIALLSLPPAGNGHAGIYTFKNTLGAAGGCAFLFGLFNLFERRLFWRAVAWFTTLGALVLTVFSDSKTATALLLAAPLIAIMLYATSRVLTVSALLIGTLLFLLVGSGTFFASRMMDFDTADLLQATYGDATFTGRTGIWLFVYDYIQQSPLLGNGFRGFWSLGDASPKHGSEVEFIRLIGSSHSGFVDIALDLGLAGFGLLILLILTTFRAAGYVRQRPTNMSFLYLSIIVFVVVRNTMESVIMWSSFFDNLCFLLVGFLACYRQSQTGRRMRVERPAAHQRTGLAATRNARSPEKHA